MGTKLGKLRFFTPQILIYANLHLYCIDCIDKIHLIPYEQPERKK